jgi:NADPH:quinone reductase-like Zn-dependent oxidoreductase
MSATTTIHPATATFVRTATMQAIVQDRYGSADVLELREIDRPVPREGQVLVRVRAAGVEPGQWHLMTGLPYLTRLMGFGIRRPKVAVRGRPVAGVVDAIGPGVTRFQPGDEVFGWSDGSFAEYVATRESELVSKPAGITFEAAAAVPISGETALQAVRDTGGVTAGEAVLVLGAAGGVGSFAVQIAKALGATVTGVTRTDKLDLVRSIGADDVIDYTTEDIAAGGPRFDVIIDTAGRRPLSHVRRALRPSGTLVIVGGEGGGRLLGGFGRNMVAPLVSRFTSQQLRSLISDERPEHLEALTELIESGKVTPLIDRTYSLAEVPEAMRHLHSGTARGKLVIAVS